MLALASDAPKDLGGWVAHDTRLILFAVLAIAVIVVLITWAKLHPFLALIVGSAVVSLGAGQPVADVVSSFETGVGNTLREVGLLIALGAMLGKLLADSGGADRIVNTLVDRAGPRLVPWAIGLVAMLIGLPMFFEIGLVLLLPVIVLVARRSELPLMRVAIPALAGLSVLHGLLPPHPGPLIAIGALGASLGTTLAFGILVAVPTVIICGPLFSYVAARWVPVPAPAVAGGVDLTEREHASRVGTPTPGQPIPTAGQPMPIEDEPALRTPSFAVTVGTILFPVVLMLAKALADIVWDDEDTRPTTGRVLDFIGEPLVAMFLAVLLALFTFGYALRVNRQEVTARVGASLGPIAGIMLIVGAGGGFKQSLIDAGVGDSIAKAANNSGLSTLIIAYLLAVSIRLATGSATVATTTAAGIIAPLAVTLDADGNITGTLMSSTHLALLALAIGAGSLFLSHVNDAGFWLVKEMFGLTVGQTFKTWSVMETLISLVGFGFVSILWVIT